MSVEMSFKGLKEAADFFKSLKKEMKELETMLYTEAEMIMTDSKNNYVPKKDGILTNSGVVDKPKKEADGNISVSMGYGGAAEAYALPVHEYPEAFSPPSWEGVDVEFHPEGRGPKYLEKPMNKALETMPDRFAVDINRMIDKAKKG